LITAKHFAKKSYLSEEHTNKIKKFIEKEADELAENLHLLNCILEGFAPVEDPDWID